MRVAVSQLLLTSCFGPIHNTAWGDVRLLGEAASLICSPLQGLRVKNSNAEGPLLQSSATLGDWLGNESSLAFGVWMTPAEASDAIEPILSLGTSSRNQLNVLNTNDAKNDDESFDDCADRALELSTYQGHGLLRFRNHDGACRTLYLSQVDWMSDELVQLVLLWDYDQASNLLSVYVNGQAVYENVVVDANASRPLMQSWNVETVLWLFGNAQHPQPFRGWLAQVSWYFCDSVDAVSTRTWVQQLWQQGVTRAEPLPLEAAPAARVTINQDADGPIDVLVAAKAASTSQFQISMELVAAPMHGTLFAKNRIKSEESDYTQRQLSYSGLIVGTVLAFPVSQEENATAELTVTYVLDGSDYFNAPSMIAHGVKLQLLPESFAYRLVARDALGRQLAVSSTVLHPITVVHVNHPPTLTGPTAIEANATQGNTAMVSSIEVIDAIDFDIDRVRVDVWAEAGYMTLNSKHLHLADFDSCRGRSYSPWQCTGDGRRDRNMTFMAVPSDVNSILDALMYEAMASGVSDDIVVRVSDGQGGACLSREEHEHYTDSFDRNTGTSFHGCYQVQAQVHVPPLNFDSGPDASSSDHKGLFGSRINTARLLFWTLVVTLGLCCWSCLRLCPKCLARGSKIEVDEDVNDDDSAINEDSEIGRRASF